ncbi:hypothetical protein LDENG_00287470 [Lucifuga dentata]|nr:hypothetical protein LDENG_00287470 [Lucifuga dentata]
MEEEGPHTESADTVQVLTAEKLYWTGGSYLYAGPGRKPRLLKQLESYLNRELQSISSTEPNLKELKLQVYRDVFDCFIKEFQTYQPLLSAIKKEYDNTLAYQQDQIREQGSLRSHLRLVTEECDKKIQARLAEEQTEIQTLKRENQQLQKHVEDMRESRKAVQAVVDRLQSELSNQYLQFREEHDARKLLICQLNDLRSCFVKEDHPADENTEAKNHTELQHALKVCQEDLAKVQEELNNLKAEYWDVVPLRNWNTQEQIHKQTLLQLKNLQGDFDQLKSEYDTLRELHRRDGVQTETDHSISGQMDESVYRGQNQIQSDLLKVLINADVTESGTLTAQEFRAALSTAFPLKSDQAIDELVASAYRKLSSSCSDTISYQRLYSLGAEGRNGEFLSLVKKQSLEERRLYVSQLRKQLGNKGQVSVSDLHGTLMRTDPALDSDTLDWNLSLAFQVKKEELKHCATPLDTETILHCLTVADISSKGPHPSKTDTVPSLQRGEYGVAVSVCVAGRFRMGDKPLWEQIGSSFVQHYYQLFDSDRAQLGAIYIDASCLTWEGQQFQGKNAIVEKLTSLPFTKIAHSITAQDHQPTPDSCIMSMVVGQLKADDDSVMGFHQSFILKNINDAWVCTNDMFRLAIHNFG